MKSRLLVRLVTLIMSLLLVAVLIWGVGMLRRETAKPASAAEETQKDITEVADGSVKGPFLLRLSYPRIGGKTYVSFHVYYRHDGTEELWYECGRMFLSADVASIDWADEQYDIAVTLKDGRQEVFSYDGNNQWQ